MDLVTLKRAFDFCCPRDTNQSGSADFDGDGDLDVVAASGEDDRVLWFENTDGLGQFGEEQVVSEDFDGAFYLGTADFDDDGDIDVIAAGIVANLVGWYENDGSGNFSDIIEIDANVRGATSVVAADLDGATFIDAMATRVHSIESPGIETSIKMVL